MIEWEEYRTVGFNNRVFISNPKKYRLFLTNDYISVRKIYSLLPLYVERVKVNVKRYNLH
jgi:hypothetical protein